ncbi:MAG: hypothetical protein ABEJ42_00945 [Halobacteriaceae archaeon]
MSTETSDGGRSERAAHLRSITITSIATLAGVAAGLAAWQLASGPTPGARATDRVGVATLLVAVLASYVLMAVARIDVGEFSMKDNLFVIFMTFSTWFLTWGVLLSAEAF